MFNPAGDCFLLRGILLSIATGIATEEAGHLAGRGIFMCDMNIFSRQLAAQHLAVIKYRAGYSSYTAVAESRQFTGEFAAHPKAWSVHSNHAFYTSYHTSLQQDMSLCIRGSKTTRPFISRLSGHRYDFPRYKSSYTSRHLTL